VQISYKITDDGKNAVIIIVTSRIYFAGHCKIFGIGVHTEKPIPNGLKESSVVPVGQLPEGTHIAAYVVVTVSNSVAASTQTYFFMFAPFIEK
jgi:hypothetical protein